jgi:hypothetical protein
LQFDTPHESSTHFPKVHVCPKSQDAHNEPFVPQADRDVGETQRSSSSQQPAQFEGPQGVV